jgi:Predicted permeases
MNLLLIQFEQIAPYWLIGLGLGSIISVFGNRTINDRVERLAGTRWGAFGVVPASLLGILSPLCMYGTVPLVASLARRNVPQDWLAAFMMSSVLLNPQLILYTMALGEHMAIARFVACLVCGSLAGLLVRIFYRKQTFFRLVRFGERASRDVDPNLAIRLLKNFGRALRITGPWFALGIALTAVYECYVPKSFARVLFVDNPGFGVLMAATIGVPVYVCGGGTIPLLKAWLDAGMSMGSGMAFMITGPATKINNLSALKILLGAKAFALYLAFTVLFAIVTGLLTDALASGDFSLLAHIILAFTAVGIGVTCTWKAVRRWFFRKTNTYQHY